MTMNKIVESYCQDGSKVHRFLSLSTHSPIRFCSISFVISIEKMCVGNKKLFVVVVVVIFKQKKKQKPIHNNEKILQELMRQMECAVCLDTVRVVASTKCGKIKKKLNKQTLV